MAQNRNDWVPWRPGLSLPRAWEFEFKGYEDLPYDIELSLVADDGGPHCRSVRITAQSGEFVTASGLRDVPLGHLVQIAAGAFAAVAAGWPTFSIEVAEGGSIHRADHTSDEHLREVAEVYRSAREKPTRAVHNIWPWVSYSTAARWVMLARRRGFLPPADRRKKR
jgi:hypothetical protein